MSTDHRGIPLPSQGGALPHGNRRALMDEKVYGMGGLSDSDKFDVIRGMMEEDPASGQSEQIHSYARQHNRSYDNEGFKPFWGS